jgi:predicted phosphatase
MPKTLIEPIRNENVIGFIEVASSVGYTYTVCRPAATNIKALYETLFNKSKTTNKQKITRKNVVYIDEQ